MEERRSVQVERISEPLKLGEGPHWDATRQCLLYVDILGHTIRKYDPARKKHYSTELDGRVGFITPVEGSADEFVVGVESEVLVVRWGGGEEGATVERSLATLKPHPRSRINDAKVDPMGRLYVGTMGAEQENGGYTQEGALYRIETGPRGGEVALVAPGLGIANGLAWHTGRKAFYYIDSTDRAVRKYRYDIATGEISGKTIFFDLQSNGIPGFPDGMTIDSAGDLWIAVFDGSRVIQVCGETGKLLRTVPLPTPQVTSVAWGGPRLDELYVTTADLPPGSHAAPAGSLYRVTGLGVTGLPMVDYKLR